MSTAWRSQPERGNRNLIRLLAWMTLRLGRPVARWFLYPICLYFVLFSGGTQRISREYLQRIYVDSLVHDPLMLRYLVDLLGPDRIALGSDYPFPLGEPRPGELIEACGFPEETRARLLHGTALEWLGLPSARFARSGSP